ncbi:Bifunctional solanapyrone synthase 1 [Emericellopsis cladophorae]|uniref:Bifunctional solanapyrone synthase 1 n=1 Tax=Emericellopsis cladophorae TaxID=2686198 RepID=A0A9P9Y0V5_9HYPO|nr:Bifunctional solanapyrone synthase 1 [Emericellopsis cladophorae]KAI6781479.1 Bifunctional solanapyrone synthase 1 [Emericellopsis cladophorae]
MLIAQCRALSNAGLSEVLYYPEDDEYASTLSSYYSADVQDINPRCILQPRSTRQVSTGLKALSEEDGKCWLVGIRSGGHSPFPSNNVQYGVTIDLGAIDEVDYAPGPNGTAEDRTVVVGSGARWGEVYPTLEAQGAMTTGRREGHVGVAGFLLGGGFSWYSGKLGMSADNIVSYEVVLADGTVATADATENADLFKALKGVDMGLKFLEVFNSLVAGIQGDIDESVNIIFVMTPLPTTYKKGGDNILSLEETLTKNSIVVQLEALMPSDKYKSFLANKLRDATTAVQAYAEKTGQDNKWLYVNYANREQDPLGTYGKGNLDRLERMAKKYDPEGFFQDRVTGGFKITRRS